MMFYTKLCPICDSSLTLSYTPGYRLYDCPKHYFYSEREDKVPEYAKIYLGDFVLNYDKHSTTIFKYDGSGRFYYHYVTTINGHIDLDTKNLDKACERIRKLLVFL